MADIEINMPDPTQFSPEMDQPEQQFPQNPECNLFIDSIEPQVKAKNYDMNQIVSLQEIAQLLDSMAFPNTFNKNLYHSLISSSGFSIEAGVSLYQFFSGFYYFYDSMLTNRERIVNLNKELQAQKDKINSQAIQTRNAPVTANATDGLLFCEVKIKGEDLNQITNLEFSLNKSQEPFRFTFQSDVLKIPVKLVPMQNEPLSVSVDTMTGSQVIEKAVMLKDLMNTPLSRDYCPSGVSFSITFLIVYSEQDYFNLKLMELEEDINENNANITLLNRNIASVEEVFKTHLAGNTNIGNDNSQSHLKDNSMNVGAGFGNAGGVSSTTRATLDPMIDKEFDISNQIEDLLIRTTKVSYINWNKICFWLTLVYCPFIFINFFLRFDIISVLFTCGIIGVYYGEIDSKQLRKIMITVLVSFFIDLIWVFSYFGIWGVTMPFEWHTETVIRKIILVTGVIFMFVKLALAFSLWKLWLQMKLRFINEWSFRSSNVDDFKARGNNTTTRQRQQQKPNSPPKMRFVPNKTENTNRGETLIRKMESEDEF